MHDKQMDGFAAVLHRLRSNGSIPFSSLSASAKEKLKPLFQSGVLIQKSSGRGIAVQVAIPEYFQEFIETRYPAGLENTTQRNGTRGESVRIFRNSKKHSGRDAKPLFARGFGKAEFIYRNPEKVLDVSAQTDSFGVASIMLQSGKPFPTCQGEIATVENLEFFTHFEMLRKSDVIAVYTGGRASGLLLDWLASPEMAETKVTHCGDYDPAGLGDYLRIKNARSGATQLLVPENLNELVKKYGNSELLMKSSHLIPALHEKADDTVKQVLNILLKNNRALEQEILLTLDSNTQN